MNLILAMLVIATLFLCFNGGPPNSGVCAIDPETRPAFVRDIKDMEREEADPNFWKACNVPD